jgi:hypothetical protein
MNLFPVINDTPWQIIDKKDQPNKGKDSGIQISPKVPDTYNFIIAKGTITNSNSKKHKLAKEDDETTLKKKKIKVSSSSDNTQISPVGLSWDSKDWSCTYDAIFTILHDIWIQNPNKWFRIFSLVSKPLEMLVVGFKKNCESQNITEKVKE